MVASLSSDPTRTVQERRHQRRPSLRVVQNSLSARPVERQSPLLAGLHRISTGALVGLGVSMLGLSALTLHWQNRWASSYTELETAKVLEHRLQESSALLEQHHLGAARRPGLLVPTSSEKLIHLSQPKPRSSSMSLLPLLSSIQLDRIPAGY